MKTEKKFYSLAIVNADGQRIAARGWFDPEGDCYWVNGHAHSEPGRGYERYMRENSLSYSLGSVKFCTPAKF